jgi:hypothetical protein
MQALESKFLFGNEACCLLRLHQVGRAEQIYNQVAPRGANPHDCKSPQSPSLTSIFFCYDPAVFITIQMTAVV